MNEARSRATKRRKLASRLLFIPLAGTVLVLVSCVRTSGGTWYFDSAPLPEGWPELTPVGEVEIREYPTYRAAVVSEKDGRSGTTPMFRSLFQHISSNDIPMTSPVDMTYDEDDSRMTGMAFLYRTPDLGPVGADGVVRVEDVQPQAYASTGMRGSYSDAHHAEGLARVQAWLAAQSKWKADGPSRYLGYNSPFVPWFWRYGEVQVPVVRATDGVDP
ncbi:MAG: heme-binding protein [Phycisphaerales bacterium]|nr:heme-binding protein [Phycisphaerales bacterium]